MPPSTATTTAALPDLVSLAVAQVSERGSQLLVLNQPTTATLCVGVLFFAVAAWFLRAMVASFAELGLLALWPGIAIAPVCTVVGLVLCFGHERVAIDSARREANIGREIFGMRWQETRALPGNGAVRVTLRKELSTTSTGPMQTIRHYDVALDANLAPMFTGTDRVATLAFARQLARHLGYGYEAQVEDPSMTILPADAGPSS